jgi:SAM-dependent methyltransferase
VAKEKYGLTIRQGEAETLDFGRTYDNIAMFHVLEHVPDPSRLIRKCFSLLNPGGRLFIAVPNQLKHLQLNLKTVIKNKTIRTGIPRVQLDGSIDEFHLSQFTSQTLSVVLKKNGFKMIDLSLDPFFVRTGLTRTAHLLNYHIQSIFRSLTGLNIYNTIWAVGKRP